MKSDTKRDFTTGTPGTGTETPENIEKNEDSVPEPVETTPEAMLSDDAQNRLPAWPNWHTDNKFWIVVDNDTVI